MLVDGNCDRLAEAVSRVEPLDGCHFFSIYIFGCYFSRIRTNFVDILVAILVIFFLSVYYFFRCVICSLARSPWCSVLHSFYFAVVFFSSFFLGDLNSTCQLSRGASRRCWQVHKLRFKDGGRFGIRNG